MADEAVQPGARKAAVLVVSIDAAAAAGVMAQLGKEDQERVALEVARLESDPPARAEIAAVLREFHGLQQAERSVERGGLEAARRLLRQALPAEEARRAIETVESALSGAPFGFLQKADTENVVAFLVEEHPQTIALILAHLTPGRAAEILSALPLPLQHDVIKRLATMERTSPDVVGEVEKALENKLSTYAPQDLRRIGGPEAVAAILNRLPRAAESGLLETLDAEAPGAGEQVRRLRVSFEDIQRLDDAGLAAVLRGVDPAQLPPALKTAAPELRERILGALPREGADRLRMEIEMLGPVRLSDIEAAQEAILEAARRLEAQEDLALGRRAAPEEVLG